MKFIKENIFLLAILFLGASLRFILLGIVPFGVTHDELGYIFNAYSVALTGKNVFGQAFPLLTWMAPNGFPFMPIPIYLAAPLYWLLPLSPTTGRLMGALLGTADIFLLFLLVKQLTRKLPIALLSALFLAVSPWHIHLSRTAYDPNYSLFFYLLGIVIFLYEIQKKRLPIFSLVSFLFALFSYRGMSIFGLPLLFVVLAFAKISLKASVKQLMVFGAGIAVIIILLGTTALIYGKSYTAEGQALFTNPKIVEEVTARSRDAKGPLFIKRLYINKPVIIFQNFTDNYLETFSPGFLFLHGEGNAIYSMWIQGKLYLPDLPFIVIGVFAVFTFSQSIGFFLVTLLLFGALPGGIGGQPYSARDLFMSVIFPIFTASGVWWTFQRKKIKKYFVVCASILTVFYFYSLGSYLFDYYGRYAYQSGESWAKSLKDVSYLVMNQQYSYNSIIVGPTSHGDFIQYALYAHITPKEVQEVWKKSGENYSGPFVYRNIRFLSTCPQHVYREKSTLVITKDNCHSFGKSQFRITDFWGNPVWYVFAY